MGFNSNEPFQKVMIVLLKMGAASKSFGKISLEAITHDTFFQYVVSDQGRDKDYRYFFYNMWSQIEALTRGRSVKERRGLIFYGERGQKKGASNRRVIS